MPHNVGKEQGPLNLKVEERDLWGGKQKNIKSIWQRLGGWPFFWKGRPPLQIHISSLWKRLGGRIEGEWSTLPLQISILWQRLRGRVYQKKKNGVDPLLQIRILWQRLASLVEQSDETKFLLYFEATFHNC